MTGGHAIAPLSAAGYRVQIQSTDTSWKVHLLVVTLPQQPQQGGKNRQHCKQNRQFINEMTERKTGERSSRLGSGLYGRPMAALRSPVYTNHVVFTKKCTHTNTPYPEIEMSLLSRSVINNTIICYYILYNPLVKQVSNIIPLFAITYCITRLLSRSVI